MTRKLSWRFDGTDRHIARAPELDEQIGECSFSIAADSSLYWTAYVVYRETLPTFDTYDEARKECQKRFEKLINRGHKGACQLKPDKTVNPPDYQAINEGYTND